MPTARELQPIVLDQPGVRQAVAAASVEERLRSIERQGNGATAPLVTSLPAGPSDGDTLRFLADATNGIVWLLRYNSASGSAYKWQFMGGAWLRAEVATDQSMTGTSYANLATAGPQIVVPLAGDYDIQHGANMYTGTTSAYQSPSVAGAVPVDTDSINIGSNQNSSGFASRVKTVATAGSTVSLQYRTGGGGTANFRWRYLRVRPIRVG